MLEKIPIRKTAFVLLLLTYHTEFSMHLMHHNLLLSEAIYGQVLNQGRPVAGLLIRRTVAWNMKPAFTDDYTTTDAHGLYHFPEVRRSKKFGWMARLLHVPAVSTYLYALPGSDRVNLAVQGRSNYHKRQQTEGFVRFVVSDLANKEPLHNNVYDVESHVLEVERDSLPALQPNQ